MGQPPVMTPYTSDVTEQLYAVCNQMGLHLTLNLWQEVSECYQKCHMCDRIIKFRFLEGHLYFERAWR